MNQPKEKRINSCLWFDGQAEEAAKLYAALFKNSKINSMSRYGDSGSKASGIQAGSVMTAELSIGDHHITCLNGGPLFKFTPALSFFVTCQSEDEIQQLWSELSKNGTVRMGLDQYPWATKYGWTADRFGVEWQLMISDQPQKIVPAFLFVDNLFGKGQDAVDFYLSLFPNSKIETLARDEKTRTIMHCAFSLSGNGFVLMEGQGKHGHTFSPALSLVLSCENQDEVDFFWEKLTENGGKPGRCGWLEDKYGVSWQVIPKLLGQLFKSGNPKKTEAVMQAMLKMTKLDTRQLQEAYDVGE